MISGFANGTKLGTLSRKNFSKRAKNIQQTIANCDVNIDRHKIKSKEHQ